MKQPMGWRVASRIITGISHTDESVSTRQRAQSARLVIVGLSDRDSRTLFHYRNRFRYINQDRLGFDRRLTVV